MRVCAFDGCGRAAYRDREKYCSGHRSQKQRGQELRPIVVLPPVEGDCRFIGCAKAAYARGLCQGHYNQLLKGNELKPLKARGPRVAPPCTFDGCTKASRTRGLCGGHYSQWKRGQELRPIEPPAKRAKPKPAAKAKPAKAAPPPRPVVVDEGPRWVPGTLWRDLERAERQKQSSTLSRNVAPATLLYTDATIPEEAAQRILKKFLKYGALDLAEALGVAS